MPECYSNPSTVTDTIEGIKCNTQIYDTSVGQLTIGETYDCQQDKYGNDYCPSSLAQCAQNWDYDAGWSEENSGLVTAPIECPDGYGFNSSSKFCEKVQQCY